MTAARVTIIIPTTCEARRSAALGRAIDSILGTADTPPTILLVVNGSRYDAELLERLRQDARLQVVYESVGSLPRALRIGRDAVRTEYFGFLDDDDEYVGDAVTVRRRHLDEHPDVDVVVCNGLREHHGQDQPFLTEFAGAAREPLQAMTRANWLASCGAMYRSARVTADFFDERFKYLEWTLLGFKLAATRRLAFIDQPTFRINDTPESLSKSEAYEISQAQVLEEILRLALPADVQRAIRRKLASAHHTLSDHYRAQGHWKQAWGHHLKSLRLPGGLAYLGYSRRLFGNSRPQVKP
ncbi:glycosyltransferase family 2 protein [Roseateles sp. BYS96W]|uniref:Glycosyltransferase family 2 protein n=1 Tax=Pelomonas nitida TaxID=3299027 RepID=A0ABW7G7W1_9BURK